jgi:hypothetical protein
LRFDPQQRRDFSSNLCVQTGSGTHSASLSNTRLQSKAATVISFVCHAFLLAQSSHDLHEELKNVLTLYREKKPTLEIVKTPEVFISQSCDPDEVQNWLRAKGFSEK